MNGSIQGFPYAQGIADEINYNECYYENSWNYVKEVYSKEELDNMKKHEVNIFNAVMHELKKPLKY